MAEEEKTQLPVPPAGLSVYSPAELLAEVARRFGAGLHSGGIPNPRAAAAPAAAPAPTAPPAAEPAPPAHLCRPLVVSGPSGVGKGTLVAMLRQTYPKEFGFSVSHTTRKPRPGERNGVEYHFVSKDEFRKGVDAGSFVEWAQVHGNYYGTSVAAVEAIRRQNMIPLLEVDVKGATQLKEKGRIGQASFVFVAPPSMDELEARLRRRGTEDERTLQTRLHNANEEIHVAQQGVYDAFLINDDLEQTFQVLKALVNENRRTCSSSLLRYVFRGFKDADHYKISHTCPPKQ